MAKEANRKRRRRSKAAHPAGAAAGAGVGAVAGAMMGALAGPAGAGLGAALGGVAGGLAGSAVAEIVNPSVEDAYWRENFRGSAGVDPSRDYEYYQPAYRFGWESYSRYGRRSFEEIDDELEAQWEKDRASSAPDWDEARGLARDAWDRVARHQKPRG